VNARSVEDLTTISHVGAGSIAYDASKAAACLAFIDGLTCEVDSAALQREFVEKCSVVLQGRAESGSACSFDEDCVPGSFCARPGCNEEAACCAGTCDVFQPGVVVAEGGDCSVNSVCEDG